eukprot:2585557-Pleurochrysis_carterae.AAC.1
MLASVRQYAFGTTAAASPSKAHIMQHTTLNSRLLRRTGPRLPRAARTLRRARRSAARWKRARRGEA